MTTTSRIPSGVARAVDVLLEAGVIGGFSRLGYRIRRRLFAWTPLDASSLRGRTILVTGATSGLGLASARRFAALGARVRLLARDEERAWRTVEAIRSETGNDDVTADLADLADLAAVHAFADRFAAAHDRLDVLVNNAGALLAERSSGPQGLETTVAVHVVAPFLLTQSLFPLLEAAAPARVITVSSGGMYTQRLAVDTLEMGEADYDGTTAYARAKRAQVVLTSEWARRFPTSGIVFHAMHPGWAATPGVETSLPHFARVMGPMLRTADEGADTIVWLAADERPLGSNGEFWLDRRPRWKHYLPWTRSGSDEARRLWEWCEARVARVAA